MKKYLRITLSALLMLVFLLSLCACGKTDETVTNQTQDTAAADTLPTVINTTEYLLYQNIFYNEQGSDYDGQTVTKKGTFTAIEDKFNNVRRYYVWGYNDQTKCCDWQWELKITDTSNLPSNGSLTEVTGEFVSDDNALDGYWIDNPQITVTQEYNGPDCDLDMTAMSSTLERVQLINIQQYADAFEGKSICLYGRVYSPDSIQHPYYDSVWTQNFETADTVPAIGTVVIVSGTFSGGVITDSTVTKTDLY